MPELPGRAPLRATRCGAAVVTLLTLLGVAAIASNALGHADKRHFDGGGGNPAPSAGFPAGNTPPSAVADAYSTPTVGTLAIGAQNGVLANDRGGPLQLVSHTDPTHGSLTLNPDGSFE